MPGKTFVIDSNVFLHDPEAVMSFVDSDVVIPLAVLEELDHMKRYRDELAKNARAALRFFDSLKKIGEGDLHKGVILPNKARLRIQLEMETTYSPKFSMSLSSNSYRILMSAYYLFEKGEQIVIVSKDLTMRVKAEAMGLEAEDYENKKFSYDSLYQGWRTLSVSKSDVDHFFKDGRIKVKEGGFLPNEYCLMTAGEQSFAVGKYNATEEAITSLQPLPSQIWGLQPLNVEQQCALDLLLRDDVKLVTLVGPAGTGKTLLALAAALRKVFDEGVYSRILVSRPIVPLGRDIGYLPGLKEEKLIHWMQPIYDNLEYLCASTKGGRADETLTWVTESNKLEMEAVTYIRGRSLPKIFMIIDEAQNLSPHEVKTVISRAGRNTKVVLTGDPTQIDNPYLDKDSNGLTYTVGRFKEHDIFGHIFMEKTERSELAALAAEVM
jgi:PhoH-like ATPase